ncbi:MAG: 6-phosphogluconate dehydrogenase, decarboxylating [Chlamydiia bacterium]|nr:6-phosphogluconate dehydrogenase, decarboxylating [Chlamydiia bacterium]
MSDKSNIGVIGLAVMGQNLILNFNDHNFKVSCFNRTTSKVDDFMNDGAKGTKIKGCHTIEEFVDSLEKPRRILLMVKAGDPVDEFIKLLTPHLDEGDIIIDGGNSFYKDTERRIKELEPQGFYFLGCGISGGEDGARHGPSMMPGGSKEAWKDVKDMLQTIAAKTPKGDPCCDFVGEGGAGHYVKMVHNGIEYGDIQLICEASDMLMHVLGLDEKALSETFKKWNKGDLDSFLIEITANIFAFEDTDGTPLLRKVVDVAMQKGTGKWTAQSSLNAGVPLSMITESVYARYLSTFKPMRKQLAKIYSRHTRLCSEDKDVVIDNIEKGLYAAKIISYTQGYMLMKQASDNYKWNLNYGAIARMWMNGCIIRSKFLSDIENAYAKNANLESLLHDEFFKKALLRCDEGWRKSVSLACIHHVPCPCFSSALSFFDGITSETLPANLLMSIRDYFGAHTYQRTDKPEKEFFHTNWTGHGGSASSAAYNA